MKDQIQAVIDMGSSSIRVSIARCHREEIEILGCGVVEAPAMENGIITNLHTSAQALRQAADEAERQSGFEIRNVDVSIGGAQVSGINSDATGGVLTGRITNEDITQLVTQARGKVSDDEHQILHVLEQQFIVDEYANIAAPVGMMADTLAAQVHVIRAIKNNAKNLVQTVEKARIGVNALVFSGLASSIAATTTDEREIGVTVLDIGAGTTDITAWEQGYVAFSGSMNHGGEWISSKFTEQFNTARHFADMIKIQNGALNVSLMKSATVELPNTGHASSRQVDSQQVAQFFAQQYTQLLTEFGEVAHRLGMRCVSPAGLVLTGGAAQIAGLASFITKEFNFPVRIAKPPYILGLPDHLQYDAGMMTTLGMLKLLYSPISDHVWAKATKPSIISQIKQLLRQRSR